MPDRRRQSDSDRTRPGGLVRVRLTADLAEGGDATGFVQVWVAGALADGRAVTVVSRASGVVADSGATVYGRYFGDANKVEALFEVC